jgi:DNA-binding transcriptional LysR family regulator
MTLARVDLEVAAFASPTYAKSLPRGYTMRDVAWIAWAPPLDHLSPNPELARLIRDFRPVFASDDFLVQQRAAQAGLGAIFLGRVEHRFAAASGGGELIELDVDVGDVRRTLYLAGARGALEIPRVRAVADLLVAELTSLRRPAARRTRPRSPS